VGEAAKAGDHVPVPAGEVGGAGIAESLEQWQRRLLHRQVFVVHQRHQPDLAPCAGRGLPPGAEGTADRGASHRQEAFAHQGVKSRILGEPLARQAFGKPEVQHFR